MATDPVSTRQDLEAQIVDQARRDDAFRRELVADPKSALYRLLGVELPPGIEIQVLEETPDRRYLVIPLNPDAVITGELSDVELEAVAGGAGWLRFAFGRIGGPFGLPPQ